MDFLSLPNVRSLMHVLERIYSVPRLEAFGAEVFEAIGELVPDAWMSLDKLCLTTGRVTHQASEGVLMSEEVRARVLELMPTHPVMPSVKAGAKGAIRVTDCITQRQFRETPHYCEVMSPLGLKYQTVVTMDVPEHIAGFTINRVKDFSDREVTVLQLMAPHITLAHQNLLRIEALEKRLRMMPSASPEQLGKLGLTRRESEVLYWMLEGKTDPEIAEILSQSGRVVSFRTINNHVASIFTKLKVHNRTGACVKAVEELRRASNNA
jgi:DNA-binding CsgD family transcriptional regulator